VTPALFYGILHCICTYTPGGHAVHTEVVPGVDRRGFPDAGRRCGHAHRQATPFKVVPGTPLAQEGVLEGGGWPRRDRGGGGGPSWVFDFEARTQIWRKVGGANFGTRAGPASPTARGQSMSETRARRRAVSFIFSGQSRLADKPGDDCAPYFAQS